MHGEYKELGQKMAIVDLDVVDNKLANVRLSGDFFIEPDSALWRITEAIEGLDADSSAEAITQAVEAAVLPTDNLFGLSSRGVAVAVRRAVGHALAWEDIDFEVLHTPVIHPVLNMTMDETLPEAVARGEHKPFLRIWEWDRPLVVMGSYQSYSNEINQDGVDRHGITVGRRITGGGTMFMEPGNCITYSLVVPTALVDGMSFLESYPFLDSWVIEALARVGVKAHYVPLNDIASDRGKIGGAAQKHFATGYMVHHVTLAYDIDADKMMDVLNMGSAGKKNRGHRSANKRVDPMKSQTGMARDAIIEVFKDVFTQKYGASQGEITAEDLRVAQERYDKKFSTPEWIHRLP
ncbi:lipoate--protein ligase family protein [Actinotignum sanguinis]|uniref:Biotin/lipoate A/B protein ligase family protein n=1 Tax=Schaalia turicensis TaxID=131111 RepID=A0ABZ0RC01_9ACTO|nr:MULTISPECIES: biotin/lipoate A/B protein ligase family protein [Actinotignum]WPJ88272.1 biotin/lipoate A/B protein ligase family protein [Schaalia turicensis]MDE1653718.1 biotin/lipoate A/B protein ligase family protein [Actinotignum schaalii]MDK8511958.1 biotin/lipoate A/B protein ligase family protein [Actinotignum sanguinis]MDK8518940.1 biotin/lipoate A/B protein ligase family protein [Actinotignum sanguinis]MDK8748117.1 biotin/lipoate A/B protein ligase family protein [Actinotignum sang